MLENSENLQINANSELPKTYEATLAELQKTLKSIENQTANLDDLVEQVQYANQLVLHCKNKLKGLEKGLGQIL